MKECLHKVSSPDVKILRVGRLGNEDSDNELKKCLLKEVSSHELLSVICFYTIIISICKGYVKAYSRGWLEKLMFSFCERTYQRPSNPEDLASYCL